MKCIFLFAFLANLLFSQTLPPLSYPLWRMAPQGDAAFLSRPGQTVDLAVTVRNESNVVQANVDVEWRLPSLALSGAFNAASPKTLTSRTDASGTARAQFTTGPGVGLFTVQAQARGSSAMMLFAVSQVAAGQTIPSLSAGQLHTAIRANLPLEAAPGVTRRQADPLLIGPFFLPAGTRIEPALGRSKLEVGYPKQTAAASWFAWVDGAPMQLFAHGAMFVELPETVTVSTVAASLQVANFRTYPHVRLPARDLPEATGYPAWFVENTVGARFTSSKLDGPLAATAAESCAIAVFGPGLSEGAKGTAAFLSGLRAAGKITDDNVFTNPRNASGVQTPLTYFDFLLMLDTVRTRNCKKLFLYLNFHGAPPDQLTGGGLGFAALTGGDLVVPYSNLVAELRTALSGIELCIVIDSCYGGLLQSWLKGIGLKGEILSMADGENPSIYYPGQGNLMSLGVGPLLASGNSFDAIGRLLQNSPNDSVSGPKPSNQTFTETGPRFLPLPGAALPTPGFQQTDVVRGPGANPDRFAFTFSITSRAPSIATLNNQTIFRDTMPLTISRRPVYAFGYTEGLAGLTGTAGEGDPAFFAANYAGTGWIRVGNVLIDPRPCVTTVGGSCAHKARRILLSPFETLAPLQVLLQIVDQSIATLDRTLINFRPGEAEVDFRIQGRQEGETALAWRDSHNPSRFVSAMPVIVLASFTDPSLEPPTACLLPSSFAIDTVDRTNNHPINSPSGRLLILQDLTPRQASIHTASTDTPRQAIVNIIIDGSAANMPRLTGTLDNATCRFNASGSTVAGGFNTNAVATGQIGEEGTFSTGGRELRFNSLKMTYRVGTNGNLPGGRSEDFQLAGRFSAQCSYSLDRATATARREGSQTLAFRLAAAPTCTWTLSGIPDWLTLTQGTATGGALNGSGSRLFALQVAPNSGAARTATLRVAGQTFAVTQPGTDPADPRIDSVTNGSSFEIGVSSGGWVTISGANLAATTRIWRDSDFVGGRLPERLDDVEVFFDGVRGYPYFISPTQINVLAPDGLRVDRIPVTVRRGTRSSNIATAGVQVHSPAFFMLPNAEGRYPAAVHADGALVGKPGMLGPSVAVRPAKSGDTILLYLNSLGATVPATPAAQVVSGAPPLANPVFVKIGGESARITFQGKVGSGLYQLNVIVPDLPAGEHLVELGQQGQIAQSQVALLVER